MVGGAINIGVLNVYERLFGRGWPDFLLVDDDG